MKTALKTQIIVLLILGGALLFPLAAQSKTAVLDATLGGGIHPNASAIVADTLNEQFVKSDQFIAIDRAYVSSIQAEKQFQLSGEVSDQDIKDIGETFGADYLCIANVSLLGSTYTVSARLIEVETAQVVIQESHRLQGEIDILFEIAEVVGAELVGIDVVAPRVAQPQVAQPEPVEPAKPVRPVVTAAPAAEEKPRTRGRFVLSFMIPGYTGDDGNISFSGDSYYSFYEQDLYLEDSSFDDLYIDTPTWGIDAHILVPMNMLYVSLGMSYTKQEIYVENYSTGYDFWWENFSTAELYAGVGAVFAPMDMVQVFGGVTGGLYVFTLGEDYGDDASGSYWVDPGETAFGLSIGLEGGADFFLGPLCLSAKLRWAYSGDLTGDYVFTDDYQDLVDGDTSYGHYAFTIGAGFTI